MNYHRAVSLFSNCGAGDVGYRKAGFLFDVMAELDPRRLGVCLLNHPGATGVSGDLRKTWPKVVKEYRKKAGTDRPSLLCACPPCQGMSSARSGKGKHEDADAGSKDERNLLVVVIAKVAKRLQPAMIVVENVPAFFTRKVRHPRTNQPISAANLLISRLQKDYDVYPIAADLCDFGVPQTRKRAFLTFVRRDVRGLARLAKLGKTPYPRPSHAAEYKGEPPVTLRAALKSFGLPSLDAFSDDLAESDGFKGLHAVPVWGDRIYDMVASIPPRSGRSAWENLTCRKCGSEKAGENDATCPKCSEPLPRPVVENANGTFRLVKGFRNSSYRRMRPDKPASTITTASGHVGSDNTIHPWENRLFSTLECALLQTFPKGFRWGNALKKWGHTNVRQMIGEAVPPAFTQEHGRALVGLLNNRWRLAPMASSDDRCTSAWRKLKKADKRLYKKKPPKTASLKKKGTTVRGKQGLGVGFPSQRIGKAHRERATARQLLQ